MRPYPPFCLWGTFMQPQVSWQHSSRSIIRPQSSRQNPWNCAREIPFTPNPRGGRAGVQETSLPVSEGPRSACSLSASLSLAGPAVWDPGAGGDGSHVLLGPPPAGTQVRQLQPPAADPRCVPAERPGRCSGPAAVQVGCSQGPGGTGTSVFPWGGAGLRKQSPADVGVFDRAQIWRSRQMKVRMWVLHFSLHPGVLTSCRKHGENAACAHTSDADASVFYWLFVSVNVHCEHIVLTVRRCGLCLY